MKKILFVFMFLASTFAFGQSLQIMYQGKALAAGDTIDIAVTSPYAETELYFDVVNLTEDTLIAWAARENISLVSGSDNYFCFGNCFDSATDTCVYGLDINAKDTLKNEFSAHYTPKGNAGTSLIKYSVYVEDKLSDLTAVYVGLVLYLNSVLVDVVVPFERLFKRREQTHGVDILAGGELHSRDNEQAVLLTHLHSRLAVERGVMVGQSNNVKSEQLRHSHDIIRRHIHIAAGRQTGMKV